MGQEILETPSFQNNNTLIYIRFSKIEYNNLPQLGYTAKSQRKYELLCGHVKLKGDFKLMVHRKKRPKMVFKKFLRENESILKELEKKSTKAKPYTREPWMMRSSPIEDEYEEFLRKEAESF